MATMNPTWNQPTAAEEGIKPAALPMDISQEQMKIARKQKLIDALSAQALQYRGNTEMAGNQAIQRSPLEAIAQTLTGGILGYADDRLDKQSAALPQKLADLNQSEMEKYLQMSQGETARPETQLPEGMTGPQERSIPGDQKGALVQALAGKSPVMQSFAQQRLKDDAAMQRMLGEKAAGASTSQGLIDAANGRGVAGFQPKAPEQKEIAGVIFNTETGQPIEPLAQDKQFKQALRPDGSVDYISAQTGKGNAGGGVHVTNNMKVEQQVEKEFDKKVGTGTAEDVLALGKASRQAEGTLQGISEARAAMQSGISSGMAAPFVDTFGRAAEAAGIVVDKQKLANNTQYRATIAAELAQYLTTQGGGGRGTTDKDMEILKQKYWKLEQTPQGQQQIMDMLERKAQKNQQDYSTVVGRVRSINPSAAQYLDLGMPTPAAPAQAPAQGRSQQPTAPMSAADYLKLHTGGR